MCKKSTVLHFVYLLLMLGTLTVSVEYGTTELLSSNVILDIQNKAKGPLRLMKSFIISHENSTILPVDIRSRNTASISFDRFRTTGMLVYSVTDYGDSAGFLAAFSVTTNHNNSHTWFVAKNITDVSKVGHDELHRITKDMEARNGVHHGAIPMGKNITFNVTSAHAVEARLTKLYYLLVVNDVEISYDYSDVNPVVS